MPEVFEYAVVRVVPRVERAEFMNVGVILYCRKFRFLQIRYQVNNARLLALDTKLDLQLIEQQLHAFTHICNGDARGGPIAALDAAARFRWLTAARSTIVQTSPLHPGLCHHAPDLLQQIFEQLVL